MSSQNRKIFSLLVIIICIIFNDTNISFALGKDTHKSINEYVSQQNLNKFSLNDYLKIQLGMKEGTETYFKSDYLDQQVFKWIGYGGKKEDAGFRSANHFLNPITNTGLSGNYSALQWATLSVATQSFSPFASWNDVRNNYLKALTAKDKETREDYFAMTFQGIGQVMHLVEDMSVPAHVRNDLHPPPFWNDGYEDWAKRINDATILGSNYKPYSAYAAYDSSFLIPQLFDTDRYKGLSPDPLVTLLNNSGLAEYTNANFFSEDTMTAANFPYPKTDSNKKTAKSYTGPEATYSREYFYKDCGEDYCQENAPEKNYSGYLLSAVDLNDYWRMQNPNSSNPKPIVPILDENVHKDYANLLIPRAIGYSSQVLKYFFRGQLDVVLDDGNIKIKNASDETISGGTFEFYYDKDGVRTLLASAAANSLATGNEQTITFNKPEGATSYMLVYQGQLGAEPDAVIGKYIPVDVTFAVFTISAPEKKSTVLVYDIKNKTVLFTARSNTDVDYVAWVATKSAAPGVTSMFYPDGFYQDVPPYKIDPDTPPDSPNNYYHDDNRATEDQGMNLYGGHPQSRYAWVVGSSPRIYVGVRTQQLTTVLAGYEQFLITSMGHSPSPSVDEFFTATSWEEAFAMAQAKYPLPDYFAWSDLLSRFYGSSTTDVSWYSTFGKLGEVTLNSSGYGPYALMDMYYPAAINEEAELVSHGEVIQGGLWGYPTTIHALFKMRGAKTTNAFAMFTLIVVQEYHATSTVSGQPGVETNELIWKVPKIMAQACADSYTNINDWGKTGNDTALAAELVTAVKLFFTLNGLPQEDSSVAYTSFTPYMTCNVTIKR